MTDDNSRRLLSIDLLDEGEHARLDGWGNQVVLTRPAAPGESIPVLFDAQVARTPEAEAICGQRWWTYCEIAEAAVAQAAGETPHCSGNTHRHRCKFVADVAAATSAHPRARVGDLALFALSSHHLNWPPGCSPKGPGQRTSC